MYLWDTNIAIYSLQKGFVENAGAIIHALLKENQPIISSITEIELLCWRTATKDDINQIKGFINTSLVIELDNAVKIQTVELRKMHSIKLPDAIIAASALVNDMTLITRNFKDFKKIENLKLINPWGQE